MTRSDSPYIFGEYEDEDVPEELPLDDGESMAPTDTVIQDGEAMTYRSYQARKDRPVGRNVP